MTVLVLGLLTAVALGAPAAGASASTALAVALLPAAFLHIVALRRPALLPDIAVLFSGVAADVVGGGLFGFFTLLNALAWCLGIVFEPHARAVLKPGRGALFAMTMAVILIVGLALGVVLGEPVASVLEAVLAWGWLIVFYVPMAAVTSVLLGWRRQPAARLEA